MPQDGVNFAYKYAVFGPWKVVEMNSARLIELFSKIYSPFEAFVVNRIYYLLAAFAVMGFYFRFSTLSFDSLNCDELYSWSDVMLPFNRVVASLNDIHPPMYYVLLKIWSVVGVSEVSLRLFSVLLSMATVTGVYLFAKYRVGRLAAAFSALVLLFSIKNIVYTSIARNYSLLIFFSFFASWALLSFSDRISKNAEGKGYWSSFQSRDVYLYVATSFGALMTHTVSAPYLIMLNAIVLAVYGGRRPETLFSVGSRLALINALQFAAFAIWFVMMSAGQTHNDFGWLERFSPLRALQIYVAAWSPTSLPIGLTLVAAVLVLTGAVAAAFKTSRSYGVMTLATLVGLPLTLYLVSLAKPVYMERTISLSQLGAAFAIGAGLHVLQARRVAAGRVAIMGVGIVLIFAASAYQYVARDQSRPSFGMEPLEDYRGALRLVDAAWTPQSALLSCELFTEPSLRYYGRNNPYRQFVYEPSSGLKERVGRWADFYGRSAGERLKTVWTTPRLDGLATFSQVVFLEPENFCHQNSAVIEGYLRQQGFAPASERNLQGVSVSVWKRVQ